MNISLPAFAPENLDSRDGFGSPVPRQPAHLHTQAESGAYLRESSRVPRRRPSIYLKPPYAIGSVTSLSGHAIAYRWRPLLRVRRHRASKPQGSSERVLPWQGTMNQSILKLSRKTTCEKNGNKSSACEHRIPVLALLLNSKVSTRFEVVFTLCLVVHHGKPCFSCTW